MFSKNGQMLGRLIVASACALLIKETVTTAAAREQGKYTSPNLSTQWIIGDTLGYLVTAHKINKVNLLITNRGMLGKPPHPDISIRVQDAFSNDVYNYGCEYPRGSKRNYLWELDVWVGGEVRHKNVVSVGIESNAPRQGEWLPTDPPGSIDRRSKLQDRIGFQEDAVSEEDLVCMYNDSQYLSPNFGSRKNQFLLDNDEAIGITVHQATYGWSYEYAEDFIIVQLLIKNTSRRLLKGTYIGAHVFPMCQYLSSWSGSHDDVVGFMNEYKSVYHCGLDTVKLIWFADNDGDPFEGNYVEEPFYWAPAQDKVASVLDVLSIEPLVTASAYFPSAINWWGNTIDFDKEEWQYFEPSRSGVPINSHFSFYERSFTKNDLDPDQFRLLSNREFDYGSIWTSAMARSIGTGWNAPPLDIADNISRGLGAEILLSWGPITMYPGTEYEIAFALVAGEDLHTDPTNLSNLPHNPQAYLDNLDFSDLVRNALWAEWVHDNPGIDTDGDGYRGEYRICVRDSVLVGDEWVVAKADTQWHKGDGIPDWRAALPPPAPEFWVSSTHNGIYVRFNGQVSETEKDIFLQMPDFEGYNIYLGRDERDASLSLVASYDKLNYDKYLLNTSLEVPQWELLDMPFTLGQLRCLYGSSEEPCSDTTFDPLFYTQLNPYRHPDFPNDSLFRFTAHHWNAFELGVATPISKRFPDVPDPRLLPVDSLTVDMYTEDGYLRFYEYEFTIENLLATVPYYVTVTAFDFGSPKAGVNPLESPKTENVKSAFPYHESEQPVSHSDKVVVYPNPYRIDAEYRAHGYEGRNRDNWWDERVRSIWFANLPPKCIITIFSLDGDRIRTLEHDFSRTDPMHTRHRWDLINRNFQQVESGLYYWTVEIPDRETQIGKLVIIR